MNTQRHDHPDVDPMIPYLSVIIPAYNEEKRIGGTLDAVYQYLSAQQFSWELLVVLDGPTDGTPDVVREFARTHPNVRWIDRTENRGKGFTVRQGMLEARGTVRLFTDADNSTDMFHFDKMRPLLNEGYDIVICSRDSKDVIGAQQAVPQPFRKRLLGDLGNLFVQLVAVRGIWDTQCGFKAFTQKAAERIFPVTQIERWGFDIEVLALARRFDFRIGMVPAYWIDDARTNVRGLSDYLNTLVETCKVRWNLSTGVYNRSSRVTADVDTVDTA